MRKFVLPALAVLAMLFWSCTPSSPDSRPLPSSDKLSGITYQLNVYSFADSDGDGWGDLRGVTQHLDYLDALGATALWLSPVQTAASYHNYDVLDYSTINPHLGTEADFKELIDKAREYNIDIYMDYVLNHSGRGEWFNSALSSKDSPYRSFYVLSDNWQADVAAGKVDNFAGATNPGMGSWHSAASGDLGYKGRLHFKLDWKAKTITVTETTAAVQSSNPSASLWLWIGSAGLVGLYQTGADIHEITVDVDTDWGFLVRSSSTSWDGGTKWGSASGAVKFGEPLKLDNTVAADITFGGSNIWYFASFDASMPDLNYGPYAKASESPAFKALAESADKWIKMGVNGLRLDAVLWIYQQQAEANASFLKQWYDHCNATYKARGGKGDIYMVGEAWEETSKIASYYKGLPSLFNFSYWWTLKDRINRGSGKDFARTVLWFRSQYRQYRPDFIDAIKLSNHDEDRAGNDLGKSLPKMKLAGAVLLTSPGKPFIYQGEELGYWGGKNNGDEFVRSPIRWTTEGSVAAKALNGKVDYNMLTGSMSVEFQEKNDDSILKVYRRFARARNTSKALSLGEMAEVSCNSDELAVWTMTYEDQTVLVVHNFRNTPAKAVFTDYKLTKCLVSNGEYSAAKDGTLSLGPFSSVVFEQ
ncbi:MAG: alpha-amylase [Bacteroidales bacterium]|nr:alpha-amylase [Bacteroidales bacterium]